MPASEASESHSGSRGPSSMEAQGRFLRDTEVLQGVKGWRVLSQGDSGRLVPYRAPGRAQALALEAPVASLVSCLGAWSCSPGTRFL